MTTAATPDATRIAKLLLHHKAVQVRPHDPFTWSSGRIAPIYCDNRLLLADAEARNAVQRGFVQHCLAASWQPDVIAGTATAGIPHATSLADRFGVGLAYVRGSAKAHGQQRRIEGGVPEGASVLVVEDLVATGGSALDAVQAVRKARADVLGVLAIFAYDFPATRTAFADAECPLHVLTTFPTVADVAVSSGRLDAEARKQLADWHRAPTDWAPAD